MKRGSIALARSICYEVAGPTDEDDDMTGSGYGSVDIAEILSAEVENLRAAICQTLDANSHLADGEVCTLLPLKVALRKSGAPWDGDELHNAEVRGDAPLYGAASLSTDGLCSTVEAEK